MKGKYKGQSLDCPHCEESPFKWLNCDAYALLRVRLDPELVMEDRAKFLGNVVSWRAKFLFKTNVYIGDQLPICVQYTPILTKYIFTAIARPRVTIVFHMSGVTNIRDRM